MEKIKSLWSWIANSSVDEAKWSLTLKAGIPAVVLIAGYFKLGINELDLQTLADFAVKIPAEFITLIATLSSVYGLIRKLINTFKK